MPTLIAMLWIIASVLCQVLVFNHLSLFGGVVMFYLYMLVKLPVEVPRHFQILIGFLTGFVLDMFSNTPGLHALSCTTIMWLRLPLLHLFVMAEDVKNGPLTLQKLGFESFLRYLLTVSVVYCVMIYSLEAFTLFNLLDTFLKIVISTVLTFLFLFVIEFSVSRK